MDHNETIPSHSNENGRAICSVMSHLFSMSRIAAKRPAHNMAFMKSSSSSSSGEMSAKSNSSFPSKNCLVLGCSFMMRWWRFAYSSMYWLVKGMPKW